MGEHVADRPGGRSGTKRSCGVRPRQAARCVGLGLLCCLALAAWPASVRAVTPITTPTLTPLPSDVSRELESSPSENPYKVRIHFLKSNERRHDVYFQALRGLGGGYVGVGADQNYTLFAVARAQLVWLVDIDGDVIDWHKIYAALIPISPTPADLLTLLAGRRDADVKNALFLRWGETEATRLFPLYLRYRGYLLNHLSAERNIRRHGIPVTWIADPELYAHVRLLMIQRRVFPRIGDLHGEKTLLGIGQAARRVGVTMRILYLSNVEQWFRYSPQFRRNLIEQPHDARTVVLRTLARGELEAPSEDRWHFSVQTLDDFIARVEAKENPVSGVLGLMGEMAKHTRLGQPGLSYLGAVQEGPYVPPSWKVLPPLRGFDPPPTTTMVARPTPVFPKLRAFD